MPDLALSRSYTSRPARPGERDGVDYNFVSRAALRGDDRRGRVPRVGRRLRQPLRDLRRGDRGELLARASDVVLVIDVQGARQVRQRGLALVSVFVLPPSFAMLEQRLRGRSKDSDEAIRRRLEVARHGGRRLRASTTTSSSTTSSTRRSTALRAIVAGRARPRRRACGTRPSASSGRSPSEHTD